jgi:hypothetical protein
MGNYARLRNALASRRAVSAAVTAAAALVIGAPSSAGAGGVAWTKAWAEHEVRQHFGAVTATCLPLGGAAGSGRREFRDFICAFTKSDGTRFTIHLKPRTRTGWVLVSMTQLGGPAAKTHAGSPLDSGRGGRATPPPGHSKG